MKRKKFCALLSSMIILLALVASAVPAYTHDLPHTPSVVAPRALLMDWETGRVLFEKNGFEQTYPASTTKIMTAILVLEMGDLDEIVHITEPPGVTGSSLYIVPGESFSVDVLLEALLIRSANDAAVVLARHLAGSVESFVNLMNRRAVELGATDTRFTNPHGMPDERHVSTAHDLAVMAQHGMRFERFREIVTQRTLIIPPTSETEQRVFNNSNRFLWGTGPRHQMLYQGHFTDIRYEPVDGVKTGYTNSARNCLVSSAVFNDQRFIAVVLNAEQDSIYSDSRTLLDFGFQHFHHVDVVNEGVAAAWLPVSRGCTEVLALYTTASFRHVLPRSILPDQIRHEVILDVEGMEAPVEQGSVLGRVEYYLDDQLIGTVALANRHAVAYIPVYRRIPLPVYVLVSLIICLILWRNALLKKRRKRLRRRMHMQKTQCT